MTFSRRVVATDKLPYVDIDGKYKFRKMTGNVMSHLSEYDFLGSQLSEERLKLCSAYVVIEGTQVELASCAVKYTDPKPPIFSTFLILANGETVTGLIVDKKFIVNQSPVSVNFVEFPVRLSDRSHVVQDMTTNLRTIFSFCLLSLAFPLDLFAATRISAPRAVSA